MPFSRGVMSRESRGVIGKLEGKFEWYMQGVIVKTVEMGSKASPHAQTAGEAGVAEGLHRLLLRTFACI